MSREDDIRARLDVLPWTSWATVDKTDLRWLLAEVERLHEEVHAEHLRADQSERNYEDMRLRTLRAEATVARVEALAADLLAYNPFHGSYLAAGQRFRAALDGDQ